MRDVILKQRLLLVILFFFLNESFATTLELPSNGNIVGELEQTHPYAGETLRDAGLRYGIGYQEIVRANPRIDPINPLTPQMTLLIPAQFILPHTPHQGIVINLAEYRLYYFPKNENVVITYPVGIGRKGWNTPLGETTVVAKQVNPTWHPTSKLVEEGDKHGVMIPDAFPPGPGNPLGKYVLRLGWSTILIHGSNSDGGIGERVSAGCIRMLPEDIEYLFPLVKVGTVVRVVNEPIKFAQLKGRAPK